MKHEPVTENFSAYLNSKFGESGMPQVTFQIYSEDTIRLISEIYDKLSIDELNRWQGEYAKVKYHLVRWNPEIKN